ncbi:hypothetical protein [Vibrio fluvialis]|uniref:hypothetical protein n=1 Tax=Vibrio fluvialis TaxID=676 RepID=UPI001EEAEE41|nr:hypothetical protein [Vibrio fluvialis]MCG6387519.1 hypothetical protein [Vibrio fluvialis]
MSTTPTIDPAIKLTGGITECGALNAIINIIDNEQFTVERLYLMRDQATTSDKQWDSLRDYFEDLLKNVTGKFSSSSSRHNVAAHFLMLIEAIEKLGIEHAATLDEIVLQEIPSVSNQILHCRTHINRIKDGRD